MREILFLITLALAAFSFNCGGGAANTAKPANANAAPANANKPASTPAPASSPAATNTDKEKTESKSNEDLDFTLVNKTGYDIKAVSIGPAGDKDWTPEDEVLKGRKFADGASMEIKFNPKATAEKWDLKIEWTDGSPGVEWLNVNLTKIEKITLKYDKESDKTTAVYE